MWLFVRFFYTFKQEHFFCKLQNGNITFFIGLIKIFKYIFTVLKTMFNRISKSKYVGDMRGVTLNLVSIQYRNYQAEFNLIDLAFHSCLLTQNGEEF